MELIDRNELSLKEIAEEVGYLVQTGVIPNFPGQILRLGDSDT